MISRPNINLRQAADTSSEILCQGQKGSVTVLFCGLMFLVITFLAITMNFAGLFTYHAHLQASTDCAVFSGAVMQARGLNEMARLNNDIVRDLRQAQSALRSRIYASRADGSTAAQRARADFERTNARRNAEQRRVNEAYASDARERAGRVAAMNQAGMAPIEFTPFSHPLRQLVALRQVAAETRNFGYRYYVYYWVRIGTGENAYWVRRRRTESDAGPAVTALVYQKGAGEHTYFTARLLRPYLPFMITMRGRWMEGFEGLRTYATAMPYGGRLWDGGAGQARYDVKLVRTGDVRPRPPIPDGWGHEW